jgi:ADP-ribose pyrophosphatase YjhB (NUDIX family)
MITIPKAAGILLINGHGEILVFARAKDGFRGYGVPGGKPNPGESLLNAAKRECLEETGIRVYNVYNQPYTAIDDSGGHEFSTFYAGPYEGKIQNTRPYEGTAKWGTADELINGPFGKYNSDMLKFFGVI